MMDIAQTAIKDRDEHRLISPDEILVTPASCLLLFQNCPQTSQHSANPCGLGVDLPACLIERRQRIIRCDAIKLKYRFFPATSRHRRRDVAF